MKRILIVEDDEAIRTERIALLRANGCLPVGAPPCDRILMDVNLPAERRYAGDFPDRPGCPGRRAAGLRRGRGRLYPQALHFRHFSAAM